MTVKELREIMRNVPDDYEVMIEFMDMSRGNCPGEKAIFAEYVQKPCTAQVYTGSTLMIIEDRYTKKKSNK